MLLLPLASCTVEAICILLCNRHMKPGRISSEGMI